MLESHADLDKALTRTRSDLERSLKEMRNQVQERNKSVEKLKEELEYVQNQQIKQREQEQKRLKDLQSVREELDKQLSYGVRLEAELTRSKTANSRLELGLQEMVQQSAVNARLHEAEKRSLQEARDAALNNAQLEIDRLQKAVHSATQEYSSCSDELNHMKNRLLECKELLAQEKRVSEALRQELESSRASAISLRDDLLKRAMHEEELTHQLDQLKTDLVEETRHKLAVEAANKSAMEEVLVLYNTMYLTNECLLAIFPGIL
ncbi:unnamed protein product [Echinostoma caproni]|uniref:Uncharacterized protein n=1 Tax=Echinostoma caproni TaxID=27848 RepID=A0A3P8HG34_9TREM|nr:unnamed protein product [Echinostoma caproni]